MSRALYVNFNPAVHGTQILEFSSFHRITTLNYGLCCHLVDIQQNAAELPMPLLFESTQKITHSMGIAKERTHLRTTWENAQQCPQSNVPFILEKPLVQWKLPLS